jgi:7-cyano-7-deazaguanine synthase
MAGAHDPVRHPAVAVTDVAGGAQPGLADRIGGPALVELILEASHTCYRGDREHRHSWGYGCGDCPACVLRAEGHAEWTARP